MTSKETSLDDYFNRPSVTSQVDAQSESTCTTSQAQAARQWQDDCYGIYITTIPAPY